MSITFQATDTTTSPATGVRSFGPVPINYAADWRIVSEKPNEIVMTNITSPLDNPEKIRIAYSEVNDIFKGSDLALDPSAAVNSQAKKGASILIQLTTGAVDSVTGLTFPFSAHIVLKMPLGAAPGNTEFGTVMNRLLGHFYDTQATSSASRLAALLRGSLEPVGM